ncbi:MAG: GGDEF domain-containing protein [Endomicrobium sp.]|nr:GGDEF domain-containing protein [Endomicrobium sp.]
MNKKILILLCIFLTLIGLYFIMPLQNRTIVWGSFVALAGFYYARWVRIAVFIFSAVACCISFSFAKEYPFSTLSACVIFISLIPLPYYFHTKSENCKREFFAKNKTLKVQHNNIFQKYKKSFDERQKYENTMERVVQFYVTCKKLSECTVKEEYVKAILKFIDEKVEVIGYCIFERIKFEWKLLSCSGIFQDNKNLIYYTNSLKLLKNDKQCCVIDNEEFDNHNFKTIYWPLKIEEEFLGCIIIMTELDDADRYVDDGGIFAPQIALGFKKISLLDEIGYKSRNDELTGLYLKRYFLQRLNSQMRREKRYGDSFYVLMLDLDYFKKINDKYGHLTGDKVLAIVARAISSAVRPGDLVSRYGGEEFLILITTNNKMEVKAVATKIKDSIKNIIFEENGEQFHIAVSIGVSCSSKNAQDQNFIINAADKALYRAKNYGRDQIVFYDDIVF